MSERADYCPRKWLSGHSRAIASTLLALLITCLVQPKAINGQSDQLMASYGTSAASINFTHVAVDPVTGRVYIGATNWLYQFSADLKLEFAARTGPVDDSPSCSPSDCSGVDPSTVRSTKNVNKVLVVDQETRMLVVCGSVRQGSCRRHRLDDVREVDKDMAGIPVAANDENSSTVAFIGPAGYLGAGSKSTSVLYVGATHTRLGPYRDMVPAISSRSLEPGPRMLDIIEKSFSDTARVDISFQLRDYFLVKYVYGFHSSNFVYFATVQKKTHFRALEEWGYVTRLARICDSDAGYHTYTEITIQCTSDGVDYNLLQDATVIKAGSKLADDLRIERGTDVLMGVFAVSEGHSNRASSSSALCLFPLQDIEQKFIENIHMCYNGSVTSRNMDYIAGGVNECPEAGRAGNVVNFCNEAVKLNGSVPLTSQPLIVYKNTTLTAITATALPGQRTAAFLGTAGGLVKKLLISSALEATQVEEVVVDLGHKILGDIQLDQTKKFVFASSPYKVAKIKVGRCLEEGYCEPEVTTRSPRPSSTTPDSSLSSTTLSFEKTQYSSRWKAIRIQELRPERMAIGTTTGSVDLIIALLPALPQKASYLCIFGDAAPIVASRTHFGLSCSLPAMSERPKVAATADHVIVSLAVKSTVTDTVFIKKAFVFYECSRHSSCRSCVTSAWGCNWCAQENSCASNVSQCSRTVIASQQSKAFLRGVEFCPAVRQSPVDKDNLIPGGDESVLVSNTTTSLSSSSELEIDGIYRNWVIGLISAAGALFLILSLIMLVMSRLHSRGLLRSGQAARIPLGTHLHGRAHGWLGDSPAEVPVQSWNYFGRGDPQFERTTLKPIHGNQRPVLSLTEQEVGRYTLVRLQPPLVDFRSETESQLNHWKTLDDSNRIKY